MTEAQVAEWSRRCSRQRGLGPGPKPTGDEERAWTEEYQALDPEDRATVGELLRAAAAGDDPVIDEPAAAAAGPQSAGDGADNRSAGPPPTTPRSPAPAIDADEVEAWCDNILRRLVEGRIAGAKSGAKSASDREVAIGATLLLSRIVRGWNLAAGALPPVLGELQLAARSLLAGQAKAGEQAEQAAERAATQEAALARLVELMETAVMQQERIAGQAERLVNGLASLYRLQRDQARAKPPAPAGETDAPPADHAPAPAPAPDAEPEGAPTR